MSEDGGFIKCDGCGLWIDGEVHLDGDEEFCDECWAERQEEEA
jgi:hypothetical protein